MCDLLQHSETRTCLAGYFRGSARIGSLAQYMEGRIRALIQSRPAAAEGIASNSATGTVHQENDRGGPCLNQSSIPSIVITEPPRDN